MISEFVNKLARKMISEHLGRACTITMKSSGNIYKVIRDGYGPMEYPERDECHIVDKHGNTLYNAKNLTDMSIYILENLR